MEKSYIHCAGDTPASRFARSYLQNAGLPLTDTAGSHVGHLILDVPSFDSNGQLRMGGHIDALLAKLPADVTIYGGNLNHIALRPYRVVDFLQDEYYLAQNAYITAECALDVTLPYLTCTLRNCPVLIVGWGRIGKCLSQLLKGIGADVTVAVRKDADAAISEALGYHAVKTDFLDCQLSKFRVIYNTVPHLILPKEKTSGCGENTVLIELASRDGIEHEDVVIARGLPGIHLPESSGNLIAQTFLRYYKEERL